VGVCQYKEDYNSRPITYELAIDLDTDNRPYVKKEGSSRLCVIIFAYEIVKCLLGKTFRTILLNKLSV
jgi:hypothetical protein